MPSSPAPAASPEPRPTAAPTDLNSSGGIDFREIWVRLNRGFIQIIGLAVLGLAVAAIICVLASPFMPSTTSMRVTFAFAGSEKGEYPDHSKFAPDDVRAPDVIIDTLKRQGLATTEDFQGKIRAALTIEGVIPSNVIKERDRLRIAGQSPPPYIPDEYLVTLTLPRNFSLSDKQRNLLLSGIVESYQEKFQRNYTHVPRALGNAFATLHNADPYEYEYVFNDEIQNITSYLNEQLVLAKTFRSPTTNLSFSDLLMRTRLFTQIRANEVLGLIRKNALSRDRRVAMIKMDYYLQTLDDQEQEALEQEKVVQSLLAKAQEHSQNYLLGIKSQAVQSRPETPIMDQGLVDSLLVNDAYNFLIRRALDAGLNVKRIQAEKAQLLERRKGMEAILQGPEEDQSALLTQVEKSLGSLEVAYNELISNIRKTHEDFARQQFADAIRVSMEPHTYGLYFLMAVAGAVGGFLGVVLGTGLSLLGIYFGSGRRTS